MEEAQKKKVGGSMIVIAFIIGGSIGAFGMALFTVNSFERGYEYGKQDREIS